MLRVNEVQGRRGCSELLCVPANLRLTVILLSQPSVLESHIVQFFSSRLCICSQFIVQSISYSDFNIKTFSFSCKFSLARKCHITILHLEGSSMSKSKSLKYHHVPQFYHLQNVCAGNLFKLLWLLTGIACVLMPNRWQVLAGKGDGANEQIDDVSGLCDWSVTWLSCANLGAVRLQKPFKLKTQSSTCRQLPKLQTKNQEEISCLQSIVPCKSIYYTGESIIALPWNAMVLCENRRLVRDLVSSALGCWHGNVFLKTHK